MYQLDTTFRTTPLFSETQSSLSSTLNILRLFSSFNLNWKLYISSFAQTAPMKSGVVRRPIRFFSPPPTANSVQRTLSVHVWSMYSSYVWGCSTHTVFFWIRWNQKLFALSTYHLFLSSIAIFMETALLIFLTSSLPSSCDHATHGFLSLSPLFCTFLTCGS